MRFLLFCATLAAAIPAMGQGTDFQQILSGKDLPHVLKLKDLSAEWRHVTISSSDAKSGAGDSMKQLMQLGMMGQAGKDKGANDAAGAAAAASLLGGLFGGGDDKAPVYYTQGKTASVGTETFLVAYRLDVKAPNLMELIAQSQKDGGKEPDFAKLAGASKPTPDTPVTLTLINVKSIGTMSDIRPFDLTKELADAGKGGGLMDLMGLASQKAPKPDVPAAEPAAEVGLAIAADTVRTAIQSDASLSKKGNSIEVDSASGKVILKGSVASPNLKIRAENVARKALKDAGDSRPISNQLLVKS